MKFDEEKYISWNTSDYVLGSIESRYALALNPCILSSSKVNDDILYSVKVRIEYPKKSEVILMHFPFEFAVEEGLFNYLQQVNWLHPYDAIWQYKVN
jgi:hypothetical protein